jgi:hypothetical protein
MTDPTPVQSRPYAFVGPLGKFTWRMLATVLGGQAVVLFFGAQVARGLAIADGDAALGQRWLWVGAGLSVLAVLAAGLMRRPIGVTLGWLVQILTWASAAIVPMMAIIGACFTGLWLLCLRKGYDIDSRLAS